MGSHENEEDEEKFIQMVHDFIEFEYSSPPICPISSISSPLNHDTKFLALQKILMSGNDVEDEIIGRIVKYMGKKRDEDDDEGNMSMKKWIVMKLKMDGFHAFLCHTSWVTSMGCPSGDYEYISIIMKDEDHDGSIRLIIDIDFKSQFELARPTQTYKNLTNSLPSIYVGKEENLKKIISLISSAAKHSFRERGLDFPPWRSHTYMQSKWFSWENGRENWQEYCASFGLANLTKWVQPIKPNGSGSALSTQVSSLRVNCC